jgi:hypothetical protein
MNLLVIHFLLLPFSWLVAPGYKLCLELLLESTLPSFSSLILESTLPSFSWLILEYLGR